MQHDLIRLQHMLDAGKDALQFALGREMEEGNTANITELMQ